MKIVTTQEVDNFCSLIQRGLDAWTEAGKLLVALLNRNPHIFEVIIKREPRLSAETLRTFERIGREEIYAPLLLDGSVGAKKLLTMPYAAQVRLHDASIEVVVVNGKEVVTETRKINQLTRHEVATALNGMGVRSIKEQMDLVRPVRRVAGSGGRSPNTHAESLGSLDDDEGDTVDGALAKAQANLLRARELMFTNGELSEKDHFIATALKAIGNLRFELKDGE